jgi:hypothetical protein
MCLLQKHNLMILHTQWLHLKLMWRIFMHCVGIFVTLTSVVLAVYFTAYCKPCITQEKYVSIYYFCLCTESTIEFLSTFLCIVHLYGLTDTECFSQTFQQHFFPWHVLYVFCEIADNEHSLFSSIQFLPALIAYPLSIIAQLRSCIII